MNKYIHTRNYVNFLSIENIYIYIFVFNIFLDKQIIICVQDSNRNK